MPAPKNNQYWQFRKDFFGRKKEYTPEQWYDKIIEYCEWMQSRTWNKKEAIKSGDMAGTLIDIPTSTPMSITGFCLFADVEYNTFVNYESKEGYEDYFKITVWARQIIETNQFEGAVVGAYNPNIIARKLGLTDRTDITTNGNEIKPVNVTELISDFMGKK